VNAGDVLKRAGVVTGVAAGVIGAAYGAERAVVARMRHAEDPDAGAPLLPEFDDELDIPSHDGGTLHVISRGEGPPILFAHGVTLSSRVWAKQFRSIPDSGFRAIAFDARGHGASKLGETGHSIDNLADDVRTVLDTLELHHALLVGHSMGGMALQAFAIRHPHIAHERAGGLVLMSTAATMPMSDARRVRGALDRVVGAAPDVGILIRQRNLGFLLARVGFGEDPHPSHVEATREMLAACSRQTLREASRSLLSLDLTAGLPNVTLPTLVLAGAKDAIIPVHDSLAIAELVPGARFEEFPGAGHMLMYERADEVDKLVVEFARECRV
jgi:pimeloyl-ACP methyl ester carboxylesterase